MNEICTKTLKEIKLLYSGERLEAMLQAFEIYPTFKTDCAQTRRKKKYLRDEMVKLILKEG